MSEHIVKCKIIPVKKEEICNPENFEEKDHIVYFKHKNSSKSSVINFQKEEWDMFELGKEYWYEIRKTILEGEVKR